jgi:2-hydroxychromene-2-carboxylate isomerase
MSHPTLDFWFDFASTYSYPAAMRVGTLAAEAEVEVRFRPFLLGPIFKAQGWTTSPFNVYPHKGRYMWRDLERLCAELGIPFRRPDLFPQNSLLAARVALAGFAGDLGRGFRGEDFCRAVFAAEFADGHLIDDPVAIGNILARLSVEPSRAFAAAQSDAVKARLRAETEEAQRLGLFGAPSFVTAEGELFWGNERLETALRWASRGNSE